MKVTLIQSGGFVGAAKECTVDSALLDPAGAREVERLVEESGLTASGTFLSPAARDLKQYEIVLEGTAARGDEPDRPAVRVLLDDSTVPAPARGLLAYLKQRSRPQLPG